MFVVCKAIQFLKFFFWFEMMLEINNGTTAMMYVHAKLIKEYFMKININSHIYILFSHYININSRL